jgi:glycerol-3-phosphate O-acyltransferase/dihydroxyacetone phosphate acyltransferase
MGPTTTLIAYQAEKERIRCLKASNVKVKGNDVVGSYKILLSMIYFPITTGIHTTLFYFGLRKFTEYGREKCLKLSLLIPLFMPIYAMLMVKSYDSFGRSFRKLTLLFLRLFRRSIYDEFNQKKKQMSNKITELVDKYGGEVFEDF